MVSGPVDFVGEYALNFAWKGKKKMFNLLGVRTQEQFLYKLSSFASNLNNLPKDEKVNIDSIGGTPDDVYEKIIYAGLIWKHPEVKLEQKDGDPVDTVYTADIIERFFLEGHDQVDFDYIIEDALVEAGLFNREQIKFSRIYRNIKTHDDIKKALKELDSTFKKLETTLPPEPESKGDDPGESPGSSQPTSTI